MQSLFDDLPATTKPPALPLGERPKCRNHARVPSIGYCEACMMPLCQTCRFSWPGERHFCPACATAPREHLIAARRTYTAWSLGLAGLNSAGLMLTLALGATGALSSQQSQQLLGVAVIFLCFMPGIVGLALGIAARNITGIGATSRPWLPLAWNALVLGSWIVLMILGNARK